MSSNDQLHLTLGSQSDRKRFGRVCIYCGARAETRDHVPAKLLLRRPFPENYRTVPSCRTCNEGFSLDEEYLRLLIGIASFDPQIMAENHQGQYIDRMLNRSRRLEDRINASLSIAKNGRVYISPEMIRINRVCAKLACGLFALRYGAGRLLPSFDVAHSQHSIMDLPQAIVSALYYWPGVRAKTWTIIQQKSFKLLFARGWRVGDPPLWCFLELHETVFAAVRCPSPPRGRRRIELEHPPW